jgi:hypothetical protein
MDLERQVIIKYLHFKKMKQIYIYQKPMLAFREETDTFALVEKSIHEFTARVLGFISNSFFFIVAQHTILRRDQIHDQNDTRLPLLSINNCINLKDCLWLYFISLKQGEVRWK